MIKAQMFTNKGTVVDIVIDSVLKQNPQNDELTCNITYPAIPAGTPGFEAGREAITRPFSANVLKSRLYNPATMLDANETAEDFFADILGTGKEPAPVEPAVAEEPVAAATE